MLTNFMTNKTFVLVSIGLVWESAKSGSQHIRDVVNSIGTSLDLSEVRYTHLAFNCQPLNSLFLLILIYHCLLLKVLFALCPFTNIRRLPV